MLKTSIVKNQEGYMTIVAALLVLILLTLIAIYASRVAMTEAAMAKNEVIYKRNFYLAEGAALEATDHLVRSGNLRDNPKPWMEMIQGNLSINSLRFYWDNSTDLGDSVIPEPSKVDPDHTLYIIGYDGISLGSSLNMSKATMHSITIYSRCSWDGISIIKMGFQAAY
jgi:hypothetical protein